MHRWRRRPAGPHPHASACTQAGTTTTGTVQDFEPTASSTLSFVTCALQPLSAQQSCQNTLVCAGNGNVAQCSCNVGTNAPTYRQKADSAGLCAGGALEVGWVRGGASAGAPAAADLQRFRQGAHGVRHAGTGDEVRSSSRAGIMPRLTEALTLIVVTIIMTGSVFAVFAVGCLPLQEPSTTVSKRADPRHVVLLSMYGDGKKGAGRPGGQAGHGAVLRCSTPVIEDHTTAVIHYMHTGTSLLGLHQCYHEASDSAAGLVKASWARPLFAGHPRAVAFVIAGPALWKTPTLDHHRP